MPSWYRTTRKEFWKALESKRTGEPITYVEIGVFTGDSAEAVCTHLLTHPESKGYGIDPYYPDKKHGSYDDFKAEAFERMKPWVEAGKWVWKIDESKNALVELYPELRESVDVLYIDGDHRAGPVVQDFVLAMPLLKPGSVVIFDDYIQGKAKTFPHVQEAVLAVEIAFAGYLQPIGAPHKQRAYVFRGNHYDQTKYKLGRKSKWIRRGIYERVRLKG